jgi:predicted RNA binding protein YcfA (HicA-like mRNA interferase family)
MPPRDFEVDLRAIRLRLDREGWRTRPSKGPHEIYVHPSKPGHVAVPRGRGDLPVGTARAIAISAGWVARDTQKG